MGEMTETELEQRMKFYDEITSTKIEWGKAVRERYPKGYPRELDAKSIRQLGEHGSLM